MIRVRRWWLSEGKNCTMSKVRVLVNKFLTQPVQMMCVSAIPTSIVDLNFRLPSWLGWMKSFAAMENWSLSPITFLISLPTVLSRTIGLKDFGESQDFLFSLEMTTVVDLLKYDGQYPSSIQVLVMWMMISRHSLSLRMILRWLHDNLSGLGTEALLQLAIAILNSSLENKGQEEAGLSMISSRISTSTWWWRAVLNVYQA